MEEAAAALATGLVQDAHVVEVQDADIHPPDVAEVDADAGLAEVARTLEMGQRRGRGGRRRGGARLPDMRFEQSYLHSIAAARGAFDVLAITVRDQVMAPLIQGCLYALALHGLRAWFKGAGTSGYGAGSRLRDWWITINRP